MPRYGHSLRGRQAEAVAKLPDLSLDACQIKRATGTDSAVAADQQLFSTPRIQLLENGARFGTRFRIDGGSSAQSGANTNPTGAITNGALTASGGTRTPNHRFRRPMLYPIELRTPTIKRCESSGPPLLDESGDSAVLLPYRNRTTSSNQKTVPLPSGTGVASVDGEGMDSARRDGRRTGRYPLASRRKVGTALKNPMTCRPTLFTSAAAIALHLPRRT
jgi:hypothetical protein